MISMEVMSHFPIIAIMTMFFSAFLVAIFGRIKPLRVIIVSLAALTGFVLMVLLIEPIMMEGQVITYWMGDRVPIGDYAIGIGIEVDALNLFFALLASLGIMLAAFYSFRYMTQDDVQDKYFILFLMLSGSIMGFILSGDLFNMFVMLEIMTFATVALVSFRSWHEGAYEAGFKYLTICTVGSTCVLLGITLIYGQCHTLNLAQISALASNDMNPTMVMALALLFTGFGVKSFMVPFHPIEADANTAAPTSAAVVISGVLTKAGVYGMIRVIYFLFRSIGSPAMQTGLVIIGCVSMFVAVTLALNQHDLKRLLAYHSVSQIGYVLTGIGLCSALGIVGGLYHAFNHTLFKGLLFLVAGAVLYSTGTVNLDKLGGLAKKMPRTAALYFVGALSISGIPPFNGFVSKWMIYQASYEKAAETGSIGYALVTVIAVVTSVLTLASFVKVGQSVFFGELPLELENAKDPPLSMRIPMWIMAALCLGTGVFPNLMQKYLLNPAMNAMLNADGYIDAMLGDGYAASHLTSTAALAQPTYSFAGYWDPLNWLILFAIVLLGVFIAMTLGSGAKGAQTEAVDNKHDTFFGGEKNTYSQVGSGDLFWGFRYNFRHYLGFLYDAHTGVTNDYVIWGVTDLALIIVYCFIFI